MLRSVAAGGKGESLRLYEPDPALLFSSLDARRPGYPRAVELARAAGFEPVIRLAGGHAAVFLESSLAFAWASADPDPQLRIKPRFERLTGWFRAALEALGLDARVGEVAGEYCPGEYSINLAGRVKVFGVGQRVIRGGAHVGGVLTIGQTGILRDVLIPIYEALELDFDPETAGGLQDFDAALGPAEVVESLSAVLRAEGFEIEPASFDSELQRAADRLMPMHSAERQADAGAALRSGRGSAGRKVLFQGHEPRTEPTTRAEHEDARTDSSDPTKSRTD